MFEYRVTKYDPRLRDSRGAYTRDEWTAFSQIGRTFGGVLFTAEAYRGMEDAYVSVAVGFLREAGCPALIAQGVENAGGSSYAPIEGEPLPLDRLDDLLRRILREEFWCRLQGDHAFIHVGWDYYLYVGVGQECPEARHLAAERGLFVERFISPYHPETEQE